MTAERLRSTPLGTRVVVRSYIEGGQRATDTIGHLVALNEDSVTVETKAGPADLLLADVILSKPVPPAPERRAPWRKPS